MAQFNVLTEPWIRAIDVKRTEQEYGLFDLLSNAHQLDSIIDPAPPIQFGIYRLLITFVQHALQLAQLEDLEDAIDAGEFDIKLFEAYANEIGHQRFNLFDAERPFMQTPPIVGDDERPRSVAELFYHLPTGTNVIHFFKMEATEHAVSPAVAARALCSIAPFMTSGGAGYSPSVNGTPPWYVLAKGSNLFETILYNICVMDISGLDYSTPPIWAAESRFEPRAEKEANSLAEGFTWQPRQVRLFPSPGGVCTYSGKDASVLIRGMAWGPGHRFDGHDRWFDPHVSYTHDPRRGRLPLRPRGDRELWRDYGPLFLQQEKDQGQRIQSRPTIVRQLMELKRRRIIPRDKAELFEVYGMRVDKAKVFEWQYERMPLRSSVLENPNSSLQVQHALELAEQIATGLFRSLKHQYPGDGVRNRNALAGIIRSTQAEFWSALQGHFEAQYLPQLAKQEAGDEAARMQLLNEWKKTLRSVGWRSFEWGSSLIESGAKALQRQVLARNSFALSLTIALDGRSRKKAK